MILVVELFRVGIEHQSFNAALLQSVAAAFPDEPITFWADARHIECVAELIPSLPVQYRAISVAPRHASFFKRYLIDSKILREAMVQAAAPDNRALFSSVTVPMLWALRLGSFSPSHQLAAVIHSGLADLQHSARFNLVRRLLSLRAALLATPSWVRFWVLEQGIYQKLEQLAPALAKRTAVLLHPLPPDLDNREHQGLSCPVRIGLLGLATPQKGLLHFLRLAKAFSGREIAFELVGRVHQSYRQQLTSELHYLDSMPVEAPLPRAEFVARIKRLSYAAFFFDGNHYSLTASGVLLDCIALGIPLLGRRHPHFEQLQANVGEIGCFCEPGGEVAMVEALLANPDQARYQAQCQAMRRLADERRPDVIGKHIRLTLVERTQ